VSDRAEPIAIDANVILRHLVGDGGRLAEVAASIMEGLDCGEGSVTCDPVTLAEVVWALGSFYELPNREISEGLLPLVQAPGFIMPNKQRYILALRLLAEVVGSYGDACACALALLECEGRLYSFDRKLSSVPGIRRSEQLLRGG